MRLVTWNVLWRFDPDWKQREGAILAVLEELGAVTVDPPRSEPDRKPRRCAVERKHVDALLKSLSMSLSGAL